MRGLDRRPIRYSVEEIVGVDCQRQGFQEAIASTTGVHDDDVGDMESLKIKRPSKRIHDVDEERRLLQTGVVRKSTAGENKQGNRK